MRFRRTVVRKAYAALLEQVRTAVRRRGFAIKTEQTYLHWIMRFIAFLGNEDPSQRQTEDVVAMVSDPWV